MPIENAEALGGRRMGMMTDESKTAALRREIVLISDWESWGGGESGDFSGGGATAGIREAMSDDGDMVEVVWQWLNDSDASCHLIR